MLTTPGRPPEWAPVDEPRKLEEDSGFYFRDINAAHYPQHPLEPAARVVLAQAPDMVLDGIDVFACGSTMGNLLRFARKSDMGFRFVVETVGGTVFLVRRENSPDEKIPDVVGYGHSFPKEYTKLDGCVQTSDSHQRMIKYDFAGFECLVRYESDGYLLQNVGDSLQEEKSPTLPQLDGLALLSGGKFVSQKALLEIKTRSSRKQLTLDDVLSGEIGRLWLRQIPNFVLAYHTSGVFNDIQVHDVRQEIKTWEAGHQKEIKALSAALAKVVEMARADPDRRFEVCSDTPGVLEIRHVGGEFPNALPDDLVRLWAGNPDLRDESDGESEPEVGSDIEAGVKLDPDEEGEEDFTACSEEYEYCGRCKY